MGQKDATEKTLESYTDVFADIVNVLLFDGKQFIALEDLRDALPRSIYKADGSSMSRSGTRQSSGCRGRYALPFLVWRTRRKSRKIWFCAS